jgi:hypothetical protein
MILLAGKNPTPLRLRVIQGGRAGAGNGLTEGWKKEAPMVEQSDPLTETRISNRLMLAKEYENAQPLSRRGWARYPQAEVDDRVENISQQPEALRDFLRQKTEENQVGTDYWVSLLGKSLIRKDASKRADAAQNLAFLASDQEIYGNMTSVAALSGLLRGASKGIEEAKDALSSLGLDADRILRETGALPFSLGALARRVIRLFSRKIDIALRDIEIKLKIEL